MKKADVEALFGRLAEADPEPRGELDYQNPFTLLVAVVLSAQATDVGVNKATPPLFAAADTPDKMVALGEARVREFIKSIGLYRNKAKNVVALSQRLIDEFDGEVPADRAALESLPGVGRKTASVVLAEAWGHPAIAVDTHVKRLANRLGLTSNVDPVKIEHDLRALYPERRWAGISMRYIQFGRDVCDARKPRCWECPLADRCPYPDKTPPP